MCADKLSRPERSSLMSRVQNRDTAPERALRRLLTDMGYRYRLQYKRVPGRPDIAFPGRRKVIWVHGCFWHGHPGCPKGTLPKSRQDFWVPKLEGNRSRDIAVQAEAQRLGWQTLVVWECELRQQDGLNDRLSRFLESRSLAALSSSLYATDSIPSITSVHQTGQNRAPSCSGLGWRFSDMPVR